MGATGSLSKDLPCQKPIPCFPLLFLCGTGQTSSFCLRGVTQPHTSTLVDQVVEWCHAGSPYSPIHLQINQGTWGDVKGGWQPPQASACKRKSFPGAEPEDSSTRASAHWRVPSCPLGPPVPVSAVAVRCPSRARCPHVAMPWQHAATAQQTPDKPKWKGEKANSVVHSGDRAKISAHLPALFPWN